MKIKKFLPLFIFLFIAFKDVSYSLTLSNLRTELRRILRDTDSSRQRFTDAFLLDFTNEAQREITNAIWVVEESSSRVLSPLTTYYLLPNDVITITGIEFLNSQNNYISLDETTYKKLEADNPGWRRFNAAPVEYFVDNATTTNQLVISYIPIPDSSSTGTVTVRYISQVDDLSADADVPFNGRRELYTFHM
ncbi:MAG: hypothetical protein AABY22_08325, partial [Nanoarchaeota archaeon]